MEEPTRAPRCSTCGAVLPANASGMCAACAFDACADATSMPAGDSSSRLPSVGRIGGLAADRRGELDEDAGTETTILQPGQTFGPYRIGRLLGRGGMGEVYEAEHLAHGRRVALKVLNQRLRRADDRVRFLQEGQLAAAVNHPNTVYIFSSEELDGQPVITMELLPGGTLKDRVKARGPLPPPEAIDAILQVIAGLEAAHAGGILHRDVKPSNCFVAADGTVKVGDFGLSISSLPRHVTTLAESGAFQGTPEYAAPEQLRGERLDLRADIYAVGATLFYLLTAHPPSENQDRAALVSTAPPPSARHFQPAIPRELDRLVARCLAKHPDMRPATYAEIARGLTRVTSLVSTPAPLGRRAAAGLLDAVALLPVQALCLAPRVGSRVVTHEAPALAWALCVPTMMYGTVAEAATGTTLGMRQCGLRVRGAEGGRPDIAKAVVRNALALIPLSLALVVSALPVPAGQASPWHWLAVVSTFVATTALLFAPARARNGLSALQDRLARARIVLQPATEEKKRAEPAAHARPAPPAAALAQIGPYDVVEALGPTDVGELFVGFDPRLKRSVWIHVAPSESPAASAASRDAAGLARLHWLNGQRTAFGSWDAYEVPAGGTPLSGKVVARPPSWQTLSESLIDLTTEIDQGLRAGTPAVLSLDRVWLTPEGRVVLLDFRAPGTTALAAAGTATVASAQRFLFDVAARALGARVQPLPLSASALMERLASGSFNKLEDVASALAATRGRPDQVSRALRGTALAVTFITWAIGGRVLQGVGLWVSNVGGAQILCAAMAVFWAFALRSGFWLRIFGIAVVTADGREASRLRAVGRAALAWSWVPLQVLTATHGWWLVGGLAVMIRIAGVAWTAADAARGPHDVLAGTFLVPR